jgi:DNA repair protein SbcC/Rad50
VLAKASRDLERAADAERRAGEAWGRAERDEVAAERDLVAARRDLGARQSEVNACGQERDALLPAVARSLGSELPPDPVAEVERRVGEIQRLSAELERRVAGKSEGQSLASRAREEARSIAGRGVELIARFRAIPVPSLLQRARSATPRLEVPPALSSGVPEPPTEAARAAEEWARGLAGVAGALADDAAEARRALEELLARAREELPDGMPATLVTDVEELLEAVRKTARDLVAEAASAATDAERLAERLAEKEALTKDVRALSEQAGVYQSLGSELRADRLINFLQGEALELLAEAGSERLLFLSQDRYRLAFDQDEFYVEDRQNGDERRSVRTLSGGETFLASLALALALAEQIPAVAVTQRAALQSLFIDEGFGALDSESLEVATEALSRLGGHDRMVGVITHVSELAEKMPVRVVVERLPTGSRLEVVS